MLKSKSHKECHNQMIKNWHCLFLEYLCDKDKGEIADYIHRVMLNTSNICLMIRPNHEGIVFSRTAKA